MEAWLGREWLRRDSADGWKDTTSLISTVHSSELEIGQEATTTGEVKSQPQRTHDTSLSRKGSVRIPGFAKAVTLPHPTPRIPLSLNLHKGVWNQNQLAFSSPTPGKPLTVLHKPCNKVSLLGLRLQESSLNRTPISFCSFQVPPARSPHSLALGWKNLIRGRQVSMVREL